MNNPEKSAPVTPESLEADLERTRQEMSDTVDALVERLDPRKQLRDLAESAKAKANEAGEYAVETVAAAKEGDTRSLAQVAAVASGVLLISGLLLRRIFRH